MKLRLSLAWLLALSPIAEAAHYVSVRGSAVVARVMDAASTDLLRDHDIEFRAATDGSSADAIYQLANNVVELAISVRMISAEERSAYPAKRFIETVIGHQALVVIVSGDVWKGGVKALTKEQLRAIYEREIRNWKEVGGPDLPITYYNRESTHGVWDLYMMFLYGDVRKAPLSKSEVIDNPEETKTTIQFKEGAFSVLEFGAYKEGSGVHAISVKQPDGSVVAPTLQNIANGRYGVVRPLVIITGKQPTGKLREMVDFMKSEQGQAAVKKTWNVSATELEAAKKAGDSEK